MVVLVSIPRRKYRMINAHLFKGRHEQGCFLFAKTDFTGAVLNLYIKEAYFLKADHWDHQSEYHLELNEKEKVKVMLKARKNDYDLVECHSHRTQGVARLSHIDKSGLDEFIRYVWWKLPGKIYGALVWTENDVAGYAWLPKNETPVSIREIRITA